MNAQLVKIRRLSIPGNVNSNIVQLSDIHIGSVSGKFLQRIIEKTNNLNPDLVLITGDLVDNYNKKTQEAIGLLDRLTAPVFFVTGNHEEYVGPARIAKSLNAANVTVLNNRQINYDGIQIIGIDNNVKKKDLEQVLQKIHINEANFSILMCHRPVELKTLSQTGLDLVLSGHTHSGQIFPFNHIVKLFYKPSSGLHKYNNTYQYITSGTGTWGPRMRLGSRSEIVLLEIRKEIIDSPK
jgi:predicted MPP superfamily phosphohydrolase